jgi:hypothetical protein
MLRRWHREWPILPLMSFGFLVVACIPIGPNSVKSDQVDYADAISEASKRLALTNIVKTRYGDAPSYLVASQVVAGYQLQANVTANADLVNEGGWEFGDSGGLTVGGQFNNNPTITYTPVAGADFAALLLQPIAPADVYALIAGGTPPDLVLGLLLGQINGVRNTLIERAGATAVDSRFQEFLDLAQRLHAAGAFHLRIDGTGKSRKVFLVLPSRRPRRASRRISFASVHSWASIRRRRTSQSTTGMVAAHPRRSTCSPARSPRSCEISPV